MMSSNQSTSNFISSSPISVELETIDQYMVFFPNNEMIARENAKEGHGKMICPPLELSIRGLNQQKNYEILLSVERYDSLRYAFVNGKWGVSEKRKAKEEHGDGYKKISKGIKSGQKWMEGPISFEEARITNVKEHGEKDNTFYVTPMHKYVPVLYVICTCDGSAFRFPIEYAQFIVVTAYQNKELSKWKCSKNKYSTAKNGAVVKGPTKRKAAKDVEKEPEIKRTPLVDTTNDFSVTESLPYYPPSQFQSTVFNPFNPMPWPSTPYSGYQMDENFTPMHPMTDYPVYNQYYHQTSSYQMPLQDVSTVNNQNQEYESPAHFPSDYNLPTSSPHQMSFPDTHAPVLPPIEFHNYPF